MDDRRGATADDTQPGIEDPSEAGRTVAEADLPDRIAALHEAEAGTERRRRRDPTLEWGRSVPTAEAPRQSAASVERPSRARIRPPTRPGPRPAGPRQRVPTETEQRARVVPGRPDEERAPRVRSNRLRHVRSAPVEPRPRIEVTRVPGRGRADVPATAPAAGRRLRRLLGVVLLLLVEVAALPSTRGADVVPPWRDLLSPGSPGFVAVAFLLLLGMVAVLPMGERLRAGLATGLGAALLAFGMALARDASASGAFGGQPALATAFHGAVGLRFVLLVVACALPGALFWMARRPRGVGPRVLVGTGVALVASAYLGLHALPGLDAPPLLALVGAGGDAAFLGDRVAAWLALLPALAAAAALVSLTRACRGLALPLGVASWAAVAAPLLALALFVAPLDRWEQILQPLQVVTVLSAGLLLLSLGAGWLLGASLKEPPAGTPTPR